MDDAEARAGKHRDRKVRDHRQMEGDAITLFEPAEVAQQCSELIDALVELLVSDGLRDLVLGLRHPDERRLVAVLRQMPINAVIGGVKPTSDKPFPEGRVAGIE